MRPLYYQCWDKDHNSECWCLKKEDERRILSAEMGWLRRLLCRVPTTDDRNAGCFYDRVQPACIRSGNTALCVTRRDRIRNDTVRSMLQQEESLVQKIRKRQLTWFGHVTRTEGEWVHCHIEGESSLGRQTWMTCIKEDVSEQDKSIQQAVELARHTAAWRRFVSASSSS